MTARLETLAARRRILVERCASQRLTLAQDFEPLRRPLDLASRGLAVIKAAKAHPVWLVGAAVLPGVLPGRAATWLRRGLLAFQVVRRFRGASPPPNPGSSAMTGPSPR